MTPLSITKNPATTPERPLHLRISTAALRLLRLVSLRSPGLATAQQHELLCFLSTGPQNVGQVRDEVGCAQATASELITRLCRVGWATKERNKKDGREVLVTLTTEGRMAKARYRQYAGKAFEATLGSLSPEERDALAGELRKIADELEGEEGGAL
jgi:DNA-binding MarR family transcriptional regulator